MNIFNSSINSLIPTRDTSAINGSIFIQNNLHLSGAIREKNILNEFLIGNIPDFLRTFKTIDIVNGNDKLTYLVMSDYLSIGSESDYVRMPMSPLTAKLIADKYDCALPTKMMVDQIWKHSTIKLNPIAHGPPYDSSMFSTERYFWSNIAIQQQLLNKDHTELIAGHKKDVIIDKQLIVNKSNVGIYGWFYTNGVAIQGPNPNCSSHDLFYADYSHSIRLVAQDVILNGNLIRFYDLLNDKNKSYLISSQGPYDAAKIYK